MGYKRESNKGPRQTHLKTALWRWAGDRGCGEKGERSQWHGDTSGLDFSSGHTMPYTGDILQSCTLYKMVLTNINPINLINKRIYYDTKHLILKKNYFLPVMLFWTLDFFSRCHEVTNYIIANGKTGDRNQVWVVFSILFLC